jgi:hypothetical protein
MVKNYLKILKTKKSLIAVTSAMLMLGIVVIPSTAVTTQLSTSPVPVTRPAGSLQNLLHKNILNLMRGMESANFTPDNVYYGVYNSEGGYSYTKEGSVVRNITLDLTALKFFLNRSVQQMSSDDSIELGTLEFMQKLLNELKNHTTINIYHNVTSNAEINSYHERKAVTIFYDKDRSVLETFETIKENRTVSTQPFTGDEIFTNVFMSLVKDKVTGGYRIINQWRFEDRSSGELLRRFIELLSSRTWLISELQYLLRLPNVNLMSALSAPSQSLSATPTEPKILERGTFEISQLRIDKLDLTRIGNNLIVKEYDYTYLEHHLLGTLIYNDTNENGYMDLGVNKLEIGDNSIAYPNRGDEALYRFDMKDIASRTYSRPITTDNVLEFGSNFTDVSGYLQPLERNQDISLFNVSTDELHSIDEVSTLFHFEVDNDLGRVDLKFDYIIGEWSNAAYLSGLSLNQLMGTTVFDAQNRRTIQWRDENNDSVEPDNENSTRVSRFRFADATAEFAEIRLDDIQYLWDQTEWVTAIGQLIPLSLIDVAYGAISSEADMIRSMRAEVSRKTYIYSISYPKWDGKEILHDPAYAVMAGSGSEDTDDPNGGIPGFEFFAFFLAIPVLIYTSRRRRS